MAHKLSNGFNSSSGGASLDAVLQRRMQEITEELIAYENDLLLRCIQFQALSSVGKDQEFPLDYKEKIFLEKYRIAEFDVASNGTQYKLAGFLPPWDGIMTDLADKMLKFSPEGRKPPQSIP